jgi:hypothetical protein
VNGVGVNTQSGFGSTDEMIRSFRGAFQQQNQKAIPLSAPAKPVVTRPTAQFVPSPATVEAPITNQKMPSKLSGGKRYALSMIAATFVGITSIWFMNKAYAPEMYANKGMIPAAVAHAEGKNYAVFDLNLNIRALRDAQLKRMTKTPDVILLGASHWQEAHKDLLKGYDMFNAHIHRDYWEDPLGMIELLVRNNRLPKKLIISIRDNQFTPVKARKDFLWEPGIPAYRDFTKRIGIEAKNYVDTLPWERGRQLMSLPMLFTNFTRWYNAEERPHATTERQFKALDVLLPDGSILWADKHMALFTEERTKKESLAFAALRHNMPPKVDPDGVYAFEKMLDFLKQEGVEVTLVHPPFNPIYYDALQGSPYAEGLKRIEELTQRIAADHGLKVFGSFNPHDIGCTAAMYIDAEHSNEKCLQKIFDQYVALDKTQGTN